MRSGKCNAVREAIEEGKLAPTAPGPARYVP
jgi:hypothetical protein